MSAKKGLGTGLNALFGEAEREAEGEIRTLPISRVEPREDQPRVSFDEASLQELAESIAGFLPKLSQDDRRIFLCRYWLFAPVEDIARRLGCSKNRVAASLFRSRQKLRKYLMEEGLI